MLKMKYPIRIYYTDDQKKMMWERWQKDKRRSKDIHKNRCNILLYGRTKRMVTH